MSEQAAGPSGTPKTPHDRAGGEWGPRPSTSRDDSWNGGGIVFAGVLLLCAGVLSVLQGITAVAKDDVYALVAGYVYKFDLTTWGVIHIVIGALAAVTGACLLKDMVWARYVGIFLAALSLVAQFLFLPYAPFWAVVVMAVDIFVIWALAVRLPLERARH